MNTFFAVTIANSIIRNIGLALVICATVRYANTTQDKWYDQTGRKLIGVACVLFIISMLLSPFFGTTETTDDITVKQIGDTYYVEYDGKEISSMDKLELWHNGTTNGRYTLQIQQMRNVLGMTCSRVYTLLIPSEANIPQTK